jgi:hypothetical protein
VARVVVLMPETLRDRLADEAQREERSVGSLLRVAARRYLDDSNYGKDAA